MYRYASHARFSLSNRFPMSAQRAVILQALLDPLQNLPLDLFGLFGRGRGARGQVKDLTVRATNHHHDRAVYPFQVPEDEFLDRLIAPSSRSVRFYHTADLTNPQTVSGRDDHLRFVHVRDDCERSLREIPH